ncbi:hypothetical protein N9B73_10590 [Verrucomicrobiales bacterium]|jgi:hypothetical protein|nr:hypothetical protein [Verrucomicrobiales bacterium]
MIEHTATFSLSHAPGAPDEAGFRQTAAERQAIPGAQDFRIQRQVSEKHPHRFRTAMTFSNRSEYDSYCTHRNHMTFVEKRRLKKVTDFQEADFVDL